MAMVGEMTDTSLTPAHAKMKGMSKSAFMIILLPQATPEF